MLMDRNKSPYYLKLSCDEAYSLFFLLNHSSIARVSSLHNLTWRTRMITQFDTESSPDFIGNLVQRVEE